MTRIQTAMQFTRILMTSYLNYKEGRIDIMTTLLLFLYILVAVFVVGMIVLVGLGIYEYKEYIRLLEESDSLSEEPPLIKK